MPNIWGIWKDKGVRNVATPPNTILLMMDTGHKLQYQLFLVFKQVSDKSLASISSIDFSYSFGAHLRVSFECSPHIPQKCATMSTACFP
jgi:hypothetical protein